MTDPTSDNTHRETIVRQAAELHAAIAQLAEHFLPVARAIVEAYNQLGRQLHQAGLLDEDGKPVQRSDRPAWQSPYGPPSRRR
ncbi:hypothetical protein ACKI1J_38845 [Streptomyces scabiei]|uniref:hypothetical protein n=1 Tax=Streptomyces scabiei TaxID=1930 RepID=UPI0039EFECBE